MRVLVSIPEETHLEIIQYDIQGLRDKGFVVDTVQYGGKKGSKGLVGRLRLTLANALKIRGLMAKRGYQIVQINSAFDFMALVRDFLTVHIISRSRSKLVFKFHGSDETLLRTGNPLFARFIGDLRDIADGFMVLSTEEKQNFLRAGFPEQKLFVVKNAVNGARYARDASFRFSHGIPEDSIVLLFVGRFIPSKGLIDLLEACSRLKKAGREFRLLCLGDGPLRNIVYEKTIALDLTERVRFLGFIPEASTKTYYANSDILVLPTYHQEGFPMAVFQAVAAGISAITTKIRAAADYLKEPDNCMWVQAGNPEQLAQQIDFLIQHPEFRKRMGENNKRLAYRFAPDQVVEDYVGVYERLLTEGKRRAAVNQGSDQMVNAG